MAVPADSNAPLDTSSAEGTSAPGLDTLPEPPEGAGTRWEEFVPGSLAVGGLTGGVGGAAAISTGAWGAVGILTGA